MAEYLKINKDSSLYRYRLDKVVRKALYGFSEIQAFESNVRCNPGKLINGKLCNNAPYEQGYIDVNNNWYAQSELVRVDDSGRSMSVYNSTLTHGINLDQIGFASYSELLEFNCKAVYELILDCDDPNDPNDPNVLAALIHDRKAHVLTFIVTMRDSFTLTQGFVVKKENKLFLLICEPCEFTPMQHDSVDIVNEETSDNTDIETEFNFEALQ